MENPVSSAKEPGFSKGINLLKNTKKPWPFHGRRYHLTRQVS